MIKILDHALTIVIVTFQLLTIGTSTYFDALDDSILHKINWAGSELEGTSMKDPLESIVMSTARGEKYRCTLPKRLESNPTNEAYTGPDPFELLAPLFSQFVCTFKLETYWSYELCHGKYIRQYHEERDGKKVKLQEYYLGRWGKTDSEKTRVQIQDEFKIEPNKKVDVPMKRIDGVNMPYLRLNMSDGTLCDLSGEPRESTVLYVCYPHGKHEIYSLEEVSSCSYEIVVLSPLLCQHPDFKSKEAGENDISCYAIDESPKIPRALIELESESFKIRHENLLQNLESLLESKFKGDITNAKPAEFNVEEIEVIKTSQSKPPAHDLSVLSDFLSGKKCLTGGSHWWKFEFCYGKSIIQYHEEGDNSRTEILLGKWNEENHKRFLDSNPQKKPQASQLKRTVYHYYSLGDQCESTGLPRAVEVKLRCVDHPSPSSIGIYLLEPKACDYTLVVESTLFCPVLKNADEYGKLSLKSVNTNNNNDEVDEQVKAKKDIIRKIKKIKASDDVEIIVIDDDNDE